MADPAPHPVQPSGDGLSTRARLFIAGGVGVVAVVVALLMANALNSPVGAGGRDAPAMPAAVGEATPGTEAGLPPLALVLDAAPPDDIGQLSPREQVPRLRALATDGAPAQRFVELGSALQGIGEGSEALAAYRQALERDPGNIGARVGLALVPAAVGTPSAMATASGELRRLAAEEPGSQLVHFNRGWLEIYRGNGGPAAAALMRSRAIDPQTPLGQTADGLLTALRAGAGAAP